MKQTILIILLLVSASSLISNSVFAQESSSILAALHPRPKVSYFRIGAANTISSATVIVIADTPSAGSLRALAYLESTIFKASGLTIQSRKASQFTGNSNAIFLGERGSFPALDTMISAALAPGETIPPAEGYILDVSSNGILLAGSDSNGTFNSISTFAQLLTGTTIPMVHIDDWPDYPIRWVFSGHNLIEVSQIDSLKKIEDIMAAHKLNGLQQNDFKNNIFSVFEGSYPPYFYNVDTLQAYSAKSNVEIIPGVFPFGWSEGILFHDPDIAEGIPTTTSFLIQDDTGILLTDPNMILPNGGFENVSNGNFTGWSFYDGPNQSVFVDSTTVHSGKYSARCTDFLAGNAAGNCRFERSVICQPFHGYRMSVWMRTQDFQGSEVQLLAIGHNGSQSTSLTYTAFSVPSTDTAWTQYNVVFNTLTYDSLYVYCGVWGGSAGTIWFDDFNIEDAGMTNLMRPLSELPKVSEAGKSTAYLEGHDYATLIDSVMENNEGSYPWHTSPTFNVLPGSAIKNGDTVQVHFIRPNPVENGANGDGSTMVCVSEDTLYPILQNQLKLVDSQYHAGKYFMSHDEIREMNWDTACTSRHLSPAQLMADNVKKADSIIQEVHPGAERFDWSDMFDSLHNAHNDYYLVNGDLTGDWNLIPKDFTIVNWNGGFMSQSLDFFSKLGFSQITSPYYDVPNTFNMRDWRLAMDTIPNMRGMMYTTWANDYSFLTPFADYAWSAGPMIVHEPLKISMVGWDTISADAFGDPYLSTDSIISITAALEFPAYADDQSYPEFDTVIQLGWTGANHFVGIVPQIIDWGARPWTYSILAIDGEGLHRSTPTYGGPWVAWAGVNLISENHTLSIYPNPASNSLSIQTNSDEPCTILIEDILGREVERFETSSQTSTFDIQNIHAGIYECVITESSGARMVLPFVKE